jgi:hypothetical protein
MGAKMTWSQRLEMERSFWGGYVVGDVKVANTPVNAAAFPMAIPTHKGPRYRR